MAQDLLEIMDQLGYRQFFVAGHDRGARTTHRMCMDNPERVLKVALMDILPNHYVWNNTTKNWAIGTHTFTVWDTTTNAATTAVKTFKICANGVASC